MRLWHKDLISVLPRQQLLSQWRECCCIARNIAVKGTPNHILVNKVLEYPTSHLWTYGVMIYQEMIKRGYRAQLGLFKKWISETDVVMVKKEELFSEWHNNRYLWQCYYNLQEKYDCGGITEEEWRKIEKEMAKQRISKKMDLLYNI